MPISIPHAALKQLCREYHIRKLALFGSVLRDDFRPDSDIDILVEFWPGKTPGLGFIDIQDRLSQLLGRTVDKNCWRGNPAPTSLLPQKLIT